MRRLRDIVTRMIANGQIMLGEDPIFVSANYSPTRMEEEANSTQIKKTSENKEVEPENLDTLLPLRAKVRDLIQNGFVEDAHSLLEQEIPELLKENSSIQANLLMLLFIDLIRRGEYENAATFATEHLTQFAGKRIFWTLNEKFEEITCDLEGIIGVLCYADPEKSGYKYMVSGQQNQLVASKVNLEILAKNQFALLSPLEEDLRQLSTVANMYKEINKEQMSVFEFKV
eukprot:TRINITY_DN13048_c0_g1_i4.p1 TRINITY_DN13048_c0_g1~~TRINITY_DN13048_c0_g1_i4.p1  ORF type:complete len:229 (-),score=38.33 TRINITY_DN13048_c0_g1_i4:109-795(-)